MTERSRFFGISDEKLYYDERKKRFVFLEDAPLYAEKAFNKNFFKFVIINLRTYKVLCSKDQICMVKNKRNSMSSSSMDNNSSGR